MSDPAGDALRLVEEAIEIGEDAELAAAATALAAAIAGGAGAERAAELARAAAAADRARCLAIVQELRARAASPASAAPAAIDDTLRDFAVEARELLDRAEQAALALDGGDDDGAVAAVFRAFHTIKGVAGFLELEVLATTAHRTESLLAAIRDGALAAAPCVDVILAGIDLVRGLIDAALRSAPCDLAAVARHERALAALAAGNPAAAAPPARPAARPPATERPTGDGGAVKIDTDKMDALVDLVGELAIAQVQLASDPALAALATPSVLGAVAAQARIVRELQRAALAMRMGKLEPTFARMARIARDTARAVGKPIAFTSEGGATELDRTMVDAIYEPLVHLVRNAIDHGLEDAATRAARGKPPAGRLTLRAYHRAGRVVVELADDGGGLDRARILERARARGLVAGDVEPPDAELHQLVFMPGFSTAATVTSVSGRGVGLDVVRTNLERVRGRVEVESTAGAGTTVRLELPLTLAIIDGLVVGVGGERYLVPLTWAREIFRPRAEQLVSIQGRGRMVDVRGALYPVVELAALLGVTAAGDDPLFLMIDHGPRAICLEVDRLLGKQEVVVKALGPTLAGRPGLAGGAILGDGRVALILDIPSLLAPPAARRAA